VNSPKSPRLDLPERPQAALPSRQRAGSQRSLHLELGHALNVMLSIDFPAGFEWLKHDKALCHVFRRLRLCCPNRNGGSAIWGIL